MKILKKLKKIFIKSNQFGSNDERAKFDEEYLFDFKSGYLLPQNTGGFISFDTIGGSTVTVNGTGTFQNQAVVTAVAEAKKKEANPVDVLHELETVPNPVSLVNLDKKIKIMKSKKELVGQLHTKREVSALIDRLINRKKYTKHCKFFDKFKNTTDDKINTLLSKYDLVMKPSDIFIPEFPDIAIEIMAEYSKVTEKISGKKPVYYVIAPESAFKKSFEKRDPILLVQSPFGFYYQILGAWDKEMLLLSEL